MTITPLTPDLTLDALEPVDEPPFDSRSEAPSRAGGAGRGRKSRGESGSPEGRLQDRRAEAQ